MTQVFDSLTPTHKQDTPADRKKAREDFAKQNMDLRKAQRGGVRIGGVSKESAPPGSEGVGEKQIEQSKEHVDSLKRAAEDAVTAVRIEGDLSENERRTLEDRNQGERIKKLREEASTSSKRNATVSMRWEALYDIGEPQALHQQLEQQKEFCALIIASKDRLVKIFQEDLKGKDDEYVKALKKQANDIERLLSLMAEQTRTLQSNYQQELISIEDAFSRERKEMRGRISEELDALWAERRRVEAESMERRQDRIAQNQNKLDFQRQKDAEDYHALHMQLQQTIHGLEQELESMRSRYQLNLEKLKYNYQVLNERVKESNETITHYKKRITRLQDLLSKFMAKYAATDKKYKKENHELTEQYKRITIQYKELQKKFKHFDQADEIKFQEVWEMNLEQVNALRAEIHEADRILHQQQLGLPWAAPVEEEMKPRALGQPATGRSGGAPGSSEVSSRNPGVFVAADEEEDEATQERNQRLLSKIFDLLTNELGFVVDQKVFEMCNRLEPGEAKLVKLDAILEELGAKSEEDIQALIPFFVDAEAEDLDEEYWISHEVVVKAVREYVEEQQRKKARQLSRANISMSVEEQQRAAQRQEERDFWQRQESALGPKTQRVWNGLERGLKRYNKILEERAELMRTNEALKNQNEELRNLLNMYLTTGVVWWLL